MKFHPLAQALLTLVAIFSMACGQEEKQPELETPPASKPSAETSTKGETQNGQNPPLNQIIDAMKRKQAAGLGSGSVKVNSAWTYTGYSVLDAVPGARLVAVDVTVTGHTPDFDFDDIEIIDGESRMSYGGDPHIAILTPPGKLLTKQDPQPKLGDPLRVLLIYGFPKETKKFTLYYWGKNLLLENHSIEANGWELPFPKK